MDTKIKVRAIIIKDGRLLLIRRVKDNKEYWVFPGGGLEEFDLTPDAGLERECKEELGVDVSVAAIFTEQVFGTYREIFYICTILRGKIGTGKGPEFTGDPKLVGTYEPEWIPIFDLSKKNVQPVEVRDRVGSLL